MVIDRLKYFFFIPHLEPEIKMKTGFNDYNIRVDMRVWITINVRLELYLMVSCILSTDKW
jgi:hypothetical protein